MNILLVAINSKFIHTNLAVYCLKAYAANYYNNIIIKEFSINNRMESILAQIYKEKPDVLAISTYVWNIEVVEALIVELKKVLPNVEIWLGGPEVSYDSEEKLTQYREIKGIIRGEGEATFSEVVQHYMDRHKELRDIGGITYRTGDDIITTPSRRLLNLDSIPFPYENLDDFKNKIIYYESSRGCPFSCSYCLSSIERSVRFKSIDLVKKDLDIFIKHKVKQVKFVDRTFNCNKQHALKIWEYLSDHDNGITNFHFEISADLLDDETIIYLQGVRPSLFQFEIGVQSTNLNTIKEIKRTMDLNRLRAVVNKLNKNGNIHLHLDLIAGLPYEDYNRFIQSFNEVYSMEPEALQLGFLKVLKGSYMYENKEEYGIQYRNQPPYEVLLTKDISYDDLLVLKSVENMVDIYYNSNHFKASIKYLLGFFNNPFEFYYGLARYYEEHSLDDISHSRLARYTILRDFTKKLPNVQSEFVDNALIYDLYCVEKLRKRPDWKQETTEDRNEIRELDKNLKNHKIYHIEKFSYDILNFLLTGDCIQEDNFALFDYENRNPITNHAQIVRI